MSVENHSLFRHGENITFEGSPKYAYIFSFEENFDQSWSRGWMIRNWTVSFILAAMYLSVVFGGPILMNSRKPLRLKGPLIFWNFGLAIFSAMAAFRLYPEFFHVLHQKGFHGSVCDNRTFETNKISAFWYWLFILSKGPELLDTVFIVLRKRKLLFLHYFHHCTTLVFTWYIYQEHAAIGRWFSFMNLVVHSVMYAYFGLRVVNVKIPRFIAMLITTSQIAQMVLGTVVSFYAYSMLFIGSKCAITETGGRSAVLIYGVHFILFVKLFTESYLIKSKKSSVKSD